MLLFRPTLISWHLCIQYVKYIGKSCITLALYHICVRRFMCMRFYVLQPSMQNDYHKNRFAFKCISKQPKTHYSTPHQLCEFFPLLHFTADLLNCCTSSYMLTFKVKNGNSANLKHHKFHDSCTPVLYFSNPVVLSCYLCHHFTTVWPFFHCASRGECLLPCYHRCAEHLRGACRLYLLIICFCMLPVDIPQEAFFSFCTLSLTLCM